MNTETNGELETFGLEQTLMEVSDGIKETQASPYRSVGVIFMGLRIPKIDEETITQELGDITIIALDHCGTRLLIRPDDFSIFFGVESAG
jgi:hypothetical protein